MAIPVILQGDSSGEVTISLAQGHSYEGATLVVVFNGVSRQYTNLTAGGSVVLAFTADETAGMPLGTALVNMRLVGANGGVETVGNADARIKVTDCVAEVNAGGSFAVTPGGNPLDGVEGLGTRYTGDQLRAKINEVIAKLGGTVAALLLCALPCLGGVTVQTAPLGGIYSDEPVVTNVTVDVSDKADATNVYTKAEVDERIVELAPRPDLTPSTNYTDAALGAFASTGAVARATVYGTPTRWADASGDVWEVVRSNGWNVVNQGLPEGEAVDWHGPSWVTDTDGDYYTSVGWYVSSNIRTPDIIGTDPDATTLVLDWQLWRETEFFEIHTIFSRPISTNNVGRVALTNDIPDVSGYATPADVTAAIREQSLGGIWDSRLGVWWTPGMADGALHYYATTNVNLNVEDDE